MSKWQNFKVTQVFLNGRWLTISEVPVKHRNTSESISIIKNHEQRVRYKKKLSKEFLKSKKIYNTK